MRGGAQYFSEFGGDVRADLPLVEVVAEHGRACLQRGAEMLENPAGEARRMRPVLKEEVDRLGRRPGEHQVYIPG